MSKPVVAIVGRPNVGKSTLFNRIVGERQAIIEDEPGTTRDRLYGQADWNGVAFTLIDTGGIQLTTPGDDPAEALVEQVRGQAEIAIAEAEAIIFVVDVRDGITTADELVGAALRQSGKPVVLAANKADSDQWRLAAAEFYQMGLGEPVAISAYHGSAIGDLLDALTALLPPSPLPDEDDDDIQVAIVGRPNVGKSALLNALLGKTRTIVSPVPGTTRDAIDTQVEWNGKLVTLIDTAGIRRRGKVAYGVEQYSVIRSLRAVNRADVVLLVIDAAEGLTAQDAHIAGYARDEYKGIVIVMNKWDLVPKDSNTMARYADGVRREFDWLAHAPVIFVSALTGQRVPLLPEAVLQVAAERSQRVPTGALNRLLRDAFEEHPAPARAGRRQKFFYATQPATKPPTFVVYITDPEALHFSYKRYLENAIRREYGFAGVPLRLSFRARGGPD
ncbi:MAG: ribosome biogenesis GTPase Der [Chloroflexi bacterium]|nr:ribosome biogenesis GTPase Der [Chloroflexota bacterium]